MAAPDTSDVTGGICTGWRHHPVQIFIFCFLLCLFTLTYLLNVLILILIRCNIMSSSI
jgi:hypothetical protein